jgi:hypothetical protein
MGGGFGGGAAAAGFAGLGYGPGMNFLLMPLSFDMQTIQAIEMSNQVRLSNYTFQLINNKLRIFPIPTWQNYIAGALVTTTDSLLPSIGTNPTDCEPATYNKIPLVSTTGTGSGAEVTVICSGGAGAATITSITVTTAGSGYLATDALTIAAAALGTGQLITTDALTSVLSGGVIGNVTGPFTVAQSSTSGALIQIYSPSTLYTCLNINPFSYI